jgi:hypothetical protein
MHAKKQALAAAGFALIPLGITVMWWVSVMPSLLSPGESDLAGGSLVVTIIMALLTGLGNIANVIAILALAVPALTRHGTRHERGFASLATWSIGSLFGLYGPVVAMSGVAAVAGIYDAKTVLILLLGILAFFAVPVSLGFSIAVVRAAPHAPRKALVT